MKRCLFAILLVCFAIASSAEDYERHAERRAVKVFDANGRVIGDLTSFSGGNGVAFTAGHATTVVPLTRVQDASYHFSATDFQWLAVSSGVFGSTDCSGDPIIESAWGPRISIPFRRGSEVTVYFAPAGPEQSLVARSGLGPDGSTCRQFDSPTMERGYAPAARLVITRHHPEPLRIGF